MIELWTTENPGRVGDPAAPPRLAAFTLVELLVVIAIISILFGILLTGVVGVRRMAKEVNCRKNLNQLAGALESYRDSYGEGLYLPPWLTWLHQYPPESPLLPDPRSFICPFDRSEGEQGGRPDKLVLSNGQTISQFPNADKDGSGDVPCSYLYELNGERCDWVYEGGLGVPSGDEYNWYTGKKPSVQEYVAHADFNGDGELSWYEVKMVNIQGWEGRLAGIAGRVPIVRCFWHVKPPVLDDSDWVLNIRSDFRVYKGHPRWWFDR